MISTFAKLALTAVFYGAAFLAFFTFFHVLVLAGIILGVLDLLGVFDAD